LCFQCQTHRVSHRGAYRLERVHRVRGSSPRVSSSSSSSYVTQAEVSSQQSRHSHLPHWPGLDLKLMEDTLSRSRHHARGELQLRSSLSESSRHTIHRSPEVHEQRPSVSTSVTFVTCPGRRFGACGVCLRSSGSREGERTMTPGFGQFCRRASTPPMFTGVPS
jgi:hypothetical protein